MVLACLLAIAAALVPPLALPPAAAADPEAAIEDGGRFEIRSAYVEPVDGVYQLTAIVDLAPSRAARRAVREGVPLSLGLDLVVERRRRYLPDEAIAAISQRWQIQYHALSQRHLVTNLNSGQQTSYATLGQALAALSQVRGLPVVDEPLVRDGREYEVSIRMVATIEGGLPNALRTMMFWIDWRRYTEWYTWTLRT